MIPRATGQMEQSLILINIIKYPVNRQRAVSTVRVAISVTRA